ncbi:MAG: metal-dependent hydrolase [Haloarculaceae archaeon]
MMATTHALAGVLLAGVSLLVAPEFAPVALLSGFAGGLAPDLDLYFAHRKTLHFPVYLPVATGPALLLAVLAPSTATIGLAAFVAAAALHSVTDVLGGGLELRPWEGTSDRAVYSHYHGRWLTPMRWVGYDGAPADLGLAATLALPVFALGAGGTVETLVIASLVVSTGYAAFRKRLPALAEDLVGSLVPDPVLPYVPDRYR